MQSKNPQGPGKATDNTFTYVGAGDAPPFRIKFLGLQDFTRGQQTEVTDERVLAKLVRVVDGEEVLHPCFVRGKCDPNLLQDMDEAAAKQVAKATARNQSIENEVLRKGAR